MPETHRPHRIEDLPRLAGATVAVRAWATTTRSSGKIAFVMLRDGTGYVQAVVSKKDGPDAAWQAGGKRTQARPGRGGGAGGADPRARRHADPHRGDRRARRHAVRDRVLRSRQGVPRPNRPALRRGGGGRAGQGVLLRPHVPRRKVENAPPSHRVLDGGARSGV